MIARIADKLMGRWKAVSAVLLSGFILAGCQTSNPAFADLAEAGSGTNAAVATAAPAVGNTPSGQATLGAYDPATEVLKVGEPIIVTFADTPQPTEPFEERIKADGSITLLLNQTFSAAGKTIGVLEKEIRARYVPRYFVNLTVTVKPQENTRFYFVGGEVKQPGRQIYLSRLTVLKAIQSSGDFTDFAKKRKVQLTRANGQTFIINADDALRKPELDLEVYPGDKIHVPRRVFW